ncbi:hypothetical protein NUU61_006912 [Penicillium alfredii]|uniref:Protein kinase domain-containing protein n=1 Tax=Penicillium alfredii TaxID=1506179 RepID=A0A9W9K4Q1_9EURO|nr:uncharacterized protein NUU61_006912 [Penicillium alfredii]KAJ5092042.1 hypothetical protein NUU61_006912 [Penicillium alfredii]
MKTAQPPNNWTAVAVHHLDQVADHHHHLCQTGSLFEELSTSHSLLKRRRSIFKHEDSPSLASVSTDRQPLMRSETSAIASSSQTQLFELEFSFTDKYGRCREIIHYGNDSTIRLHEHKAPLSGSKSRQLLAIKVYRHSILNSAPTSTAHTISSHSLAEAHPYHPNILPILDLLYNERSELCVVMPYCAGGDLRALLTRTGPLPTVEADCLVTQILRALDFLHEHDTAHRDIRLESVLITAHGAVKLAGFGDGHIRRLWEKCVVSSEADEHMSRLQQPKPPSLGPWPLSLPWSSFLPSPHPQSTSPRNSVPTKSPSTASYPGLSLSYRPPEWFHRQPHSTSHCDLEHGNDDKEKDNDPRPADVWATGTIYMALITGRLLWRSAQPYHEDGRYLEYLRCRGGEDGYPLIEALGRRRRNAIYAMLHPNPQKRITAADMLCSEWIKSVVVCEAGEKGD